MAKKTPDDGAAEAVRRFKADLKAGTLGSFYIICGEEAFLRGHYVDLVTKKLTDGPAESFNYHRFNAENLTMDALQNAIEANSISTAFPPTTARRRRWPTRSTPCP